MDPLGRLHMVLNYDTSTNPMSELNLGYSYDLLDRLTLVARDPGGTWETKTTLEYDGLGRKSRMQDYDMGSWEYEYDEAGNLKVQRDALYLANPTANAQHQVFFEYDSMNRLTHKYYGRQHFDARAADVRYHYDNALGDAATKKSWGRLRHAEVTPHAPGSKANGHGYEYDARGLVVADVVTTSLATRSYRVAYAYDTGGRLASVTYPDLGAERVDVRYNQMGTGLPQSLTSSIAGNPQPVYNALYNERGQPLTLEQGSAGSNNLLTSSFTYDEASTKRGWLSRTQVSSNGGASTHLDLNLGYTADGNISSLKQLAGGTNSPVFTNTFGYDGFDRLRTATSSNSSIFPAESYSFDERLSRMASRTIAGTSYSYTYGDPAHKDAPTAYRGNTYTYDAVGNQVTAPGQTRTFDAENRLVRIVQGTTTSEFVYDANGKRVLKSVTTSGVTKRTLYVGNLYEEELTGAANPAYISYYMLGGKPVGIRRANQASMNGQYRLVSDHLGSANLMLDTSTPPQVVERR
ncbi:MAG TPA: hypothetical protein VEY08_12030, partial [Chloroflexia bacterium]|nr:hypothetical protein [Chloroflexia bacterium]